MSDTQALLSELARVKAIFQLRAIAAVTGLPLVSPPHVQKPTPGDDQQFVEIELHDGERSNA